MPLGSPSTWSRDSGRRPTLSAGLIAYNCEPWLPACLDSMLAQDVTDVQVVVVDDGSTDATPRILADYAARHPHITVVRQENGGVSAARHTSIEHAQGKYLAFADADDLVPPGAWSTMLASLQRTGSDFVVGAAERLEGGPGGRRFMTPLMTRNHAEPREAITIEDQPLMLADVFAWNKMFDRRFWDAQQLRFPMRTSFQDQPTMTQAFLAARSFDVLSEVVYEWLVRPDETSATQQRGRLRNLQQRMETKRLTLGHVRAHGSPVLEDVLLRQIMPIDVWEYARVAPQSSDEFWATLRDGLVELWGEAEAYAFDATDLPVPQRVMGCLAALDRREDLAALVTWLDAERAAGRRPAVELKAAWERDRSLPGGVTGRGGNSV